MNIEEIELALTVKDTEWAVAQLKNGRMVKNLDSEAVYRVENGELQYKYPELKNKEWARSRHYSVVLTWEESMMNTFNEREMWEVYE